jgi:histidyl-tRNA synthetase
MMSQKCKGARDLITKDVERFRYIEDAFRSSCVNWGYQEVRTPTLEYLHLFTSAGTLTPGMLNKVYSFLDWDGWSGERVVLRPDGTIPIARLYIENLISKDISRLSYVTNVFAFEGTGKENRERWQCGVELIGDSKPAADAEIIMLALEIMKYLYIEDVEISLSHAGIIKYLIKEMKLSADKENMVLNEIREGNWKCLVEMKTGNQNIKRLFSLLIDSRGEASGFLENLNALPGVSAGLKNEFNNFAEIARLLDILDCRYRIDISSATGFEYYTGVCFHFMVDGQRVGGGGRYNDLITLIGGDETPACGFALYFDPLMNLVKSKSGRNLEQGVLIRGSSPKPETMKSCFSLAQSLRNIGYIAEFEFSKRRTKWRWVVVVRQKSPSFVITDQFNNTVKEASSIAAVVDVIGGLP